MEKNLFSDSTTHRESIPWIAAMVAFWIIAIYFMCQAYQNPDISHLRAILATVIALLFTILVLSAAASPPVKISDPHQHFNNQAYFSIDKVKDWSAFSNTAAQFVSFEKGTRFMVATRKKPTTSRWIDGGSAAIKLQGERRAVRMKAKVFYTPSTLECLKVTSEEGSTIYTLKNGQVIVPLAKPSGFPGYLPSQA